MDTLQVEENFNEAVSQIIHNLGCTASQFGPEDFPTEWKDFRNHLFGFAESFLKAMHYYLYKIPDDVWTNLNGAIVRQLRPEHLIKITGYSHYFVSSLYPYSFKSRPCDRIQLLMTLNWITCMYRNDHDLTQHWYELYLRTPDDKKRHTALLDLAYRDIAFATLSDPKDVKRSESWGGLAIMAYLAQCNVEKNDLQEWTRYCAGIFDPYDIAK